MTDEQLEEFKEWLQSKIDESKADLSGTNEYHHGIEGTLEEVLDYLEAL